MGKVLLIDDDETVLSILEKKIHLFEDVEILKGTTYKEGVKYILKSKDDIQAAIIDLSLPDAKDGDLADFTAKKGIPTIVLTGNIDDKLKERLVQSDILDYIIKDGLKGVNHAVSLLHRILKNYETNILVVDDSKMQTVLLKKILEKMKINVFMAHDGEEAMEIINQDDKKFSLVLTDYNMPKMDGMELTLKLREKYDKDTMGILVLSANDTPNISSEFIKMGANDFINKPYSEIEVITRVNSNLELIELFEKTRDMANKDFMTGAYNRRYFFESGEAIYQKAKRDGRDIAVAMFDIDKFKNINDTYGHDVGDVAICEVARILKQNLRGSDLMARFGGEEFCVLLENITLEDCKNLFEKIRLAFEQNILNAGGTQIKFTTSIGVCYGLESDLEKMIKVADDGLYYCKNNGRNQVALNKN